METLTALSDPVLLEVLHLLPARDMLLCFPACRSILQTGSSTLLWFRVYCAAYRGHFKPPPSFEELAAGAPTELGLNLFDWVALHRHRALLDSPKPLQERLTGTLCLSDPGCERPGMIDAEHGGSSRGGGFFGGGSQCAAVLRQPLEPLPLARPIAYVEVYIHGGASVGLVDSVSYSDKSHIGWRPNSLGYHGDEGSIYSTCMGLSVKNFGPTFGLDPKLVVPNDSSQAPRAADVVGVGIDFGPGGGCSETETGVVFFTKNGEYVGGLPWTMPQLRHFAFALHRSGDRASVNIGTARFLFDIEGFSQSPRPSVSELCKRKACR